MKRTWAPSVRRPGGSRARCPRSSRPAPRAGVKLEDESPQSFCSAERRESSLVLHFSDDSSQSGHSGHSHRNPQEGVRLRHLAVPRLKASPVSAVISILTSSRRQPGRGRRWRSFQCPGGALANVAGALSAPSLESWSRQVGLVEMCHNTTHRGQQASASGDYLLYTLFPPSHRQSCSVMHV